MAAARYAEKRLFSSLCAFRKLKEERPWALRGQERVDIKIIGCRAAEGSLLLPGLVGIWFGKKLEQVYLFQPRRGSYYCVAWAWDSQRFVAQNSYCRKHLANQLWKEPNTVSSCRRNWCASRFLLSWNSICSLPIVPKSAWRSSTPSSHGLLNPVGTGCFKTLWACL